MDADRVRAAYDEQVRRSPVADVGSWVESDDRVLCVLSTTGWGGVRWSDLGGLPGDEVDARIAAVVARFVEVGHPWEWKYYAYDAPADLPDRLVAAGLERADDETLLVAEIAELDLDVTLPEGIRLDDLTDDAGVARLVGVHDAVFGGDFTRLGHEVSAGLAASPPSCAAVVAAAGDIDVSAGRVEFHEGTEFASIWGGGTLEAWRGRGVFRALVAHRARLAADRGFRYLQVDASPESRPILRRLGFVELAATVPFEHPGSSEPA